MTDTLLAPLITLVTGSVAAIIAALVYRLNSTQRQDTWLRGLWEFHRGFWQDEKMASVRAWIANNDAYNSEARDVLAKRMRMGSYANGSAELTKEEYKVLETIDRFAALMVSYQGISKANRGIHEEVRQRVFDYWIHEVTQQRRPEFHAYIVKYFPELVATAA